MRLKILCEDRCEDIAVNLAAACVRSLRRSDRLRSLSDSHHVHYMIDVYIVLLYKLKRTQDIFAQVSTQLPPSVSHRDIDLSVDLWMMMRDLCKIDPFLPSSPPLFIFYSFISITFKQARIQE